MANISSTGPLPGPVRQIGYVVRDLEAALAQWVALGIGPWFVVREHTQQVSYRGAPCEVTISLALANSGELQIEIIHQHGDTPSIFTQFLDSGREGFHQLAWWADDFDTAVAKAQAAGWPVVWHGTCGVGAFVRDAARDWDGSDPVRTVGP